MATAGRIAADLAAGGTAVILLEMRTKHGESPNFIWGGNKKIYTPKNSTMVQVHLKMAPLWKEEIPALETSKNLCISTSSKNMTRGEHGSRGIGMMVPATSETHQISPGFGLQFQVMEGLLKEIEWMFPKKPPKQKLRDTSRYVWYLSSDV